MRAEVRGEVWWEALVVSVLDMAKEGGVMLSGASRGRRQPRRHGERPVLEQRVNRQSQANYQLYKQIHVEKWSESSVVLLSTNQ